MIRPRLSLLAGAVLLGLVAVLGALAQQPAKNQRVAVLVGVNVYHHADLNQPPGPLKFAERDVTEMAAVLEKSGYAVTTLTGEKASKKAILDALEIARKQAGTKGVLLVGLAGHGLQPDESPDAFYCPYDAAQRVVGKRDKNPNDPWDYGSLLPLSDVLAILRSSGAGARVLMADCCRNDPKAGRGTRSTGFGTGLKISELPDHTAVFLSCSKGQTSFEDKAWGNGHGAFFHHVLEGIHGKAANAAGRVTADRLWEYVEENVPVLVQGVGATQVPHRLVIGRVDLQIASVVVRKPDAGDMEVPPKNDGDTYTSKATGMKFVRIPKGTFTMGSPESEKDRTNNEKQHEVTLTKDFYLGIHEVTRGQFRKFVDDEGYKTDAESDGKGGWGYVGTDWKQDPSFTWRNSGFHQADDHPVVNVSWIDCVKYAAWLSKKDGRPYRLPTEAEWEYAARGGVRASRPFGIGYGFSLSSAEANFNGEYPYGGAAKGTYLKATSTVGSYKPNGYGLYDMHGNSWEWCSDWYGDYPSGRATDPTGLDSGSDLVNRGGGWNISVRYCRSAFRRGNSPLYRYYDLGFRLAEP